MVRAPIFDTTDLAAAGTIARKHCADGDGAEIRVPRRNRGAATDSQRCHSEVPLGVSASTKR